MLICSYSIGSCCIHLLMGETNTTKEIARRLWSYGGLTEGLLRVGSPTKDYQYEPIHVVERLCSSLFHINRGFLISCIRIKPLYTGRCGVPGLLHFFLRLCGALFPLYDPSIRPFPLLAVSTVRYRRGFSQSERDICHHHLAQIDLKSANLRQPSPAAKMASMTGGSPDSDGQTREEHQQARTTLENLQGYAFPRRKLKVPKDLSKQPIALIACGSYSPVLFI